MTPSRPGFGSVPGSPGTPWIPGRPPEWPVPDRPRPPAPPAPSRPPLPTFTEVVALPPAYGGELADRLQQRGIVLLTGHLDMPAAQRAAARLMLLDAEWDGEVQLHLGCPDGDLDATALLAETVDLLAARTVAVATGVVGGPVLGVLAAADRRRGHRHAVLRLREPTTTAAGPADLLAAEVAEHERLVGHLYERMASASGRPAEQIAADARAGRVLGAPEAVDYGLLDEVVPAGRREPGT